MVAGEHLSASLRNVSLLERPVQRTAAAERVGPLADGRTVDLVLSDIMMPGGMNGVELAREIKRRRRELPVLLTSGFAEASRSEAEAIGVGILPKPYRLDQLSTALQLLARHIGREEAG